METEKSISIIQGDSLEIARTLKPSSVQCIVTSPPYFGCRKYGAEIKEEENSSCCSRKRELGQEETPTQYISNLCEIFEVLRPCLKPDACLYVNIGDSIAKRAYPDYHIRSGEQMMIPSLFALEMRRKGWYIQQDIIWAKKNPMPCSSLKRCTPSHEYIYLFSTSNVYKFDSTKIRVEAKTKLKLSGKPMPPIGGTKLAGGDNDTYSGNTPVSDGMARRHDVWIESTSRLKEAHFAPFPTSIVEPCVLACTDEGDTILDPFCGSGTVGVVCIQNKRRFIGIDIIPDYVELAKKRTKD